MFPSYMLQGGSSSLLQGGSTKTGGGLQVTGASPQQTVSAGGLQPTYNPQGGNPGVLGSSTTPAGLTDTTVANTVDPAAAAAAAKAAEDAAKAAALRGEITNIANTIKDIFNSRYGQVDASAAEQSGKLNDRFATESGDITRQVEGENQKLGAAHAASGSFDSSYRGNNVDTVTRAGEGQIRDLGTEMQDNLAKIAAWITQQKTGFDAQKSGIDAVLARIGEAQDPAELAQIRNSLEGRATELRAGNADNNTFAQNRSALEGIAPSSARAQQLKTTLSQIVAGSADTSQKSVIAERLIQSAGLTPQEQQELLTAFQGDLQKKELAQPA